MRASVLFSRPSDGLFTTSRRTLSFALVAFLALMGLLATSCSSTSSNALEVGSSRLSVKELNSEVDYLVANPSATQSILGIDTSLIGTGDPAGEGQKTELIVGILNVHVYAELLELIVNENGLQPAPEDTEFVTQTLSFLESEGSQSPASLKSTLEKIVANQAMLQRKLEEEIVGVSDEQVREAYETAVADPAQFKRYRCASHILVAFNETGSEVEPTESEESAALAEAELVALRIAGGEDFTSLATEVSDDTGSSESGGYLGCNADGTFVPEFEEALYALEVGGVSAPVRTQFGYHIIRLNASGTPSFEDVELQIRSQLEQEASDTTDELTNLLIDIGSRTTIIVNPDYGVWDAETGVVLPPESTDVTQ